MKSVRRLILGTVLALAGASALYVIFAQGCYLAQGLMIDTLKSAHMVADIPPDSLFVPYLERDLRSFAQHRTGTATDLGFELLSDEPQQFGVGYTKFYMWLSASDPAIDLEGAAEVAAIDQERFEVTHFFDADDLQPGALPALFPPAAQEAIRERLSAMPGSTATERSGLTSAGS